MSERPVADCYVWHPDSPANKGRYSDEDLREFSQLILRGRAARLRDGHDRDDVPLLHARAVWESAGLLHGVLVVPRRALLLLRVRTAVVRLGWRVWGSGSNRRTRSSGSTRPPSLPGTSAGSSRRGRCRAAGSRWPVGSRARPAPRSRTGQGRRRVPRGRRGHRWSPCRRPRRSSTTADGLPMLVVPAGYGGPVHPAMALRRAGGRAGRGGSAGRRRPRIPNR